MTNVVFYMESSGCFTFDSSAAQPNQFQIWYGLVDSTGR